MTEEFPFFDITKLNPPKICKRCVLPESRPHIWLDEEGVCNICRENNKNKLKNNIIII